LQGKLRIGLAESTVLISLARALAISPPDTIPKVEEDELVLIEKGEIEGMW